MTKYRVSFIGRTAGAIGITYPIVAEVEAASEEEARLKLYDQNPRAKPPANCTPRPPSCRRPKIFRAKPRQTCN